MTTSEQPRQRSGRWIKILVAVVIVILLLIAAAEFGLRAYLKGTVADEMRSSAQDKGVELSADPEVSFGSAPLIGGLIRGKIPELTMSLPSSLSVKYQDSDQSKPVVTGQPAIKATMKDVETGGDNGTIGSLTVDTTLPPEYLLAEVQKAMSEGDGAGGTGGTGSGSAGQSGRPAQDAAPNPLAGLMKVDGVEPNTADQTLDVRIAGGLATVAMKPSVTDQGFIMEVADVKLLGFSLPDSLTDSLKDSLQQSIDQSDNLQITAAEITDDGLKVRLTGHDVTMDDLADDASGFSQGTGSSDGSGQGQRQGQGQGQNQAPGATTGSAAA
ncbi:DUF2993 domain-containing protein [Corynebacterium nuruki]|uniref:LmeA family phospholipid-binding protein n=1 Tax=Corynebacterium nuruki TaxID=1032851 RepID=UPI0039BF87D7